MLDNLSKPYLIFSINLAGKTREMGTFTVFFFFSLCAFNYSAGIHLILVSFFFFFSSHASGEKSFAYGLPF